MASLYTNENIPAQTTARLQLLGHDVVTVLEDGLANQSTPDQDILVRATAQGRAVVTLNRSDFRRLHHDAPTHAGIIVCTLDAPEQLADRIDSEISGLDDLRGELIEVFRQSTQGHDEPGTGAAERLTTSPNTQFPTSWSSDGQRLLFYESDGAGGFNSSPA